MSRITLPKNISSSAPATAESTLHPGLFALAAGGFGIGLTEFVISGLLSSVASDLEVSIPAAGALIWGYALAVGVGAFTVTAYLSKRPPKAALITLLALFIIGNMVTALAPGYAVALAGRVITALCHGGFFGIGAVVAASLVPADRKGSAMAVMFGGLTLANVLGVPFGTFVGQQWGWRASFWIVAAVGVVALIGIAALVPRRDPPAPTEARSQFQVLVRPQVLVSTLLTLLIFGGLFGAFIYVEPLVTQVSGYSASAVPWLLVLFGVGLFLGNIVGGRAADRSIGRTLRLLSIALPLTLIAYAVLAPWRAPVAVLLLLLGFVGFATTPPLQLRVMRYAADAPSLASSANIAAFNLGNAIGAGLGGLAIASGLGWRSPIYIGLAMVLLGTLLTFTNNHGDDQ